MNVDFSPVKIGLVLVFLGLLFGIGLGASFGIKEEAFKGYISDQVDANPQVHDEKSKTKIWRYAQRAHFHALGISAFLLGLIILLLMSAATDKAKQVASIFLGLGTFYPMAWFSMFILAPSLGRGPAHDHIVTHVFVYVGVIGILVGLALVCRAVFFTKSQT